MENTLFTKSNILDILPSLQQNEYQMDNKPIMEKYIGDMISNTYCEICVPVK